MPKQKRDRKPGEKRPPQKERFTGLDIDRMIKYFEEKGFYLLREGKRHSI